jgi:HAD superfamily hydrolase (TIGR01509 family)
MARSRKVNWWHMNSNRKLAAVLWDMDGTLIDSEESWMRAEQALAVKYSSNWTHDDGIDLIGLSLLDSTIIMKQRMGIHDLSEDQITDFLTDEVLSSLRSEIPWRSGARELLLELRAKGIKTALVTMSMRRMALEVVNAIGFDAFDLVIGGDDVQNGKPHPEPYLVAASKLGVEIEDCVAFEDSPNGLASAEASGAKAVAVENLLQIQQKAGRIIWNSLEGVTVADLEALFD